MLTGDRLERTGAPAVRGRPALTRLPWWRGGGRRARRVTAGGGRAVCRDLAAPRRLPRRGGGDRRDRAVLPRSGAGTRGPGGDHHHAGSPRASAPRARACRGGGGGPGACTRVTG